MSRHSEALTFEKIIKTKSGVMPVKQKLDLVWFWVKSGNGKPINGTTNSLKISGLTVIPFLFWLNLLDLATLFITFQKVSHFG